MADPKFKDLPTVEQEKEYIRCEQIREKDERNEIALAEYNRNKKKMHPYEIKPGENPRIAPNLEFFLTDTKNEKKQEDNKAIMTDEFHPLPPEKPFIPKKLGIDRETQILDNELFDFDREVNPILDTVASKVMEMAILELEEEEELIRIHQLKAEYNARKDRERERAQELIKEELGLIAVKEQALEKAQKRLTQHQNTYTRLQNYEIAAQCLSRLRGNVIGSLQQQGFYPDEFHNDMRTRYVDFLIEGTAKAIDRRRRHSTLLDNVFDQQLVKPREQARQPLFEQRARLEAKALLRRVSQSEAERVLYIFYEEEVHRASTFSRNYRRVAEGSVQEYLKTMAERKKALRQQVNTSEISEEDYSRIVKEEFEELPVFMTLLPVTGPYAFTLSFNPFYKDVIPNL